jgi:hypothetical protein
MAWKIDPVTGRKVFTLDSSIDWLNGPGSPVQTATDQAGGIVSGIGAPGVQGMGLTMPAADTSANWMQAGQQAAQSAAPALGGTMAGLSSLNPILTGAGIVADTIGAGMNMADRAGEMGPALVQQAKENAMAQESLDQSKKASNFNMLNQGTQNFMDEKKFALSPEMRLRAFRTALAG